MRLVKRAAITVTPKQPTIDWANSLDDDEVKFDKDSQSERTIYLIDDASDVFPFDRDVVVRPYFTAIFEEELSGWHLRESDWPSPRTYDTFLDWFEVEVHSMVLDLPGRRMIRTERYD